MDSFPSRLFSFSRIKKVFLKNFTFSFHIFESPVMYIVEGVWKARGFGRNRFIYFWVAHKKWFYGAAEPKKVPLFSLPISGKWSKISTNWKIAEKSRTLNIYHGRNDGRHCSGTSRRTLCSSGCWPSQTPNSLGIGDGKSPDFFVLESSLTGAAFYLQKGALVLRHAALEKQMPIP